MFIDDADHTSDTCPRRLLLEDEDLGAALRAHRLVQLGHTSLLDLPVMVGDAMLTIDDGRAYLRREREKAEARRAR